MLISSKQSQRPVDQGTGGWEVASIGLVALRYRYRSEFETSDDFGASDVGTNWGWGTGGADGEVVYESIDLMKSIVNDMMVIYVYLRLVDSCILYSKTHTASKYEHVYLLLVR